MIVCKVVEKQTRWGSNWMLFKSDCQDSSLFSLGERFRKNHPEFFPRYFKGRIVKAAPNSIGILCFSSMTAARVFRDTHCHNMPAIIIKVRGIGAPRKVKKVGVGCGSSPWLLFDYKEEIFIGGEPPFGTIAFPAVEVLE